MPQETGRHPHAKDSGGFGLASTRVLSGKLRIGFEARLWYKLLPELSITHKLSLLVHDRFDFVPGDVEGDIHGALARAFRRSASMSL